MAIARLEEAEENLRRAINEHEPLIPSDDLSSMLSSLSVNSTFTLPSLLDIVTPPELPTPGQVLLHHPALQLAHSPPPESSLLNHKPSSSPYLKNLFKWASEAVDKIKETGNEIPSGLNQSDLYLGPGSILAIEGAVSHYGVCSS